MSKLLEYLIRREKLIHHFPKYCHYLRRKNTFALLTFFLSAFKLKIKIINYQLYTKDMSTSHFTRFKNIGNSLVFIAFSKGYIISIFAHDEFVIIIFLFLFILFIKKPKSSIEK